MEYDFIYVNPITNGRFLPPFYYSLNLQQGQVGVAANSVANILAGTSPFQAQGSDRRDIGHNHPKLRRSHLHRSESPESPNAAIQHDSRPRSVAELGVAHWLFGKQVHVSSAYSALNFIAPIHTADHACATTGCAGSRHEQDAQLGLE